MAQLYGIYTIDRETGDASTRGTRNTAKEGQTSYGQTSYGQSNTFHFEQIKKLLEQGLPWLQLRIKNPTADDFHLAKSVHKLCQSHTTTFIINDHIHWIEPLQVLLPDYPVGIHLGQKDTHLATARKQLGETSLIGVTCHNSIELAQAAEAQGASYLALGRFYSSTTKPDAKAADLATLKQLKQNTACTIAVIGGITINNYYPLKAEGADLICMGQGLFDPKLHGLDWSNL